MMLVQTCASPNSRMCCATRPCGLVTVVDNNVDLVEDIQQRLKKQEKYRESCSAVAGSNTVRATPVRTTNAISPLSSFKVWGIFCNRWFATTYLLPHRSNFKMNALTVLEVSNDLEQVAGLRVSLWA